MTTPFDPMTGRAPSRQFRPYIYALSDPREPGLIRYVGMSTYKESRPLDHWYEAKNPKTARFTHKQNWIRELQREKLKYVVMKLEEFQPNASPSFVGKIEMIYIQTLRSQGHKLTNSTDGGDGLKNPTPDTRERQSRGIREAKARQTVEQKQDIVARQRETMAAKTQEEKDERTAKFLESWYTKRAEQDALGAPFGSYKVTEKQVLAIRVDPRLQRVIAEEYGISDTAVSAIKTRVEWASLDGPPSVFAPVSAYENPGSKGYRHSEEAKKRMGDLKRGTKYKKSLSRSKLSLTEEQVLAIRADERFFGDIAKDYGLSRPTIKAIKDRTIWPYLDGPPSAPSPHVSGVRSSLVNLTEDDILAIRSDTRTQQIIADTYGISKTYVHQIKYRKKWAEIP